MNAASARGAVALLVSLALWVAGCDASSGSSNEPEATPGASPGAPRDTPKEEPWPEGFTRGVIMTGWETDFSKRAVNLSEIESGGPGKDGIPAIDEPVFVMTRDADRFLAPDEPVMVLPDEGRTRARIRSRFSSGTKS